MTDNVTNPDQAGQPVTYTVRITRRTTGELEIAILDVEETAASRYRVAVDLAQAAHALAPGLDLAALMGEPFI